MSEATNVHDIIKFINRQVSLLEERMSSATNEGRWVEEKEYQCAIENLELVDEYIKAHPPVAPKQTTGKWIYDRESNVYRCSYCNRFPWRVKTELHDEIFEDLARVNAYKFCPHCGAKME